MDRERRENLITFMEEQMPCHTLTDDVVEFMLGAKPDSCSMRVVQGGSREYIVKECSSMARFPIPDLPLRYSTPQFMAATIDQHTPHHVKKTSSGQYNGAIVEFYTAAWRKGEEQRDARKEWEQRADIVW